MTASAAQSQAAVAALPAAASLLISMAPAARRRHNLFGSFAATLCLSLVVALPVCAAEPHRPVSALPPDGALAQISSVSSARPIGNSVRTGRYEKTRTEPRAVQADPLSALVEVRLDAGLGTVGRAMESLLQGTGYRLRHRGRQMQLLTSRPLASVQRFLGPVPVRDALRTLAGAEWELLQDPVHRLVAFELLPPWDDMLDSDPGLPVIGNGASPLPVSRPAAVPEERLPRLFQVRPGSLKANVERLVELWQRKLVGWDITLKDGDERLDWQLHTGWMLAAHSLEDALQQLLQPHALRAVLHARDGAVSLYRTLP